MPIIKLTFSGGDGVDRAATAEALRGVLREVLQIPSSDGPVLFFDLPRDSFQLPPEWTRRIFVEALLFPGRTAETKARLLAGLTAVVAKAFRAEPTEVLTTIVEPPLDNWGIRGGQQASQVVLGFKLDR